MVKSSEKVNSSEGSSFKVVRMTLPEVVCSRE